MSKKKLLLKCSLFSFSRRNEMFILKCQHILRQHTVTVHCITFLVLGFSICIFLSLSKLPLVFKFFFQVCSIEAPFFFLVLCWNCICYLYWMHFRHESGSVFPFSIGIECDMPNWNWLVVVRKITFHVAYVIENGISDIHISDIIRALDV